MEDDTDLAELAVLPGLDHYLVFTGPKAAATDVRTVRPGRIDAVYLFDSKRVLTELRERGTKIGIASGVREALWQEAEIYPAARNSTLVLNHDQRRRLALFAG